jgi:hypothetical protein
MVLLTDQPEVDGWLRAIFGKVFGVVAIGLGIILAAPSAIGFWAMAGANQEGAVPALSPRIRQIAVAVALTTVVVTIVVLLVTGSAVAVLNLGLLALVAMAALGLAGASSFSPHRGRALVSAIAVGGVAIGTLWVLANAFLRTPIASA